MVGKSPLPNTPLEPLIEAAREHEDPEKLEAMDGMPTFPLEILNLVGYEQPVRGTEAARRDSAGSQRSPMKRR